MRVLTATAALLLASVSAQAQPQPGNQARQPTVPQAQANAEVMKFAVNRNGDQIGTHTIELRRNGAETSVSLATRIEVKVAFITAYRFEHSCSERWVNGKFVALKATTDDNGTSHKVDVASKGSGLVVEADGKSTQLDTVVMPASLWNASLLRQSVALDTQKGSIMKMAVTDIGLETIVVQGHAATAHRYAVKSTTAQEKPFSQDVWYDEKGNLVQVQVIGPDSSIISYQLL